MNIKELAKKLNISIATVSRALNDHPEVSTATKRRVLEAATHYGYRPNAAGRSLRRGKLNTVALLLPPGNDDNFYTASFFMRVAASLQAKLREKEIDTILHLAIDDDDEMLWLQKIVEQQKADAVILTHTLQADLRIAFLHQRDFPFATLGRSNTLDGAFNWVDLDFETVARVAIERGKQAGYQRMALVTLGSDSMQGAIFAAAWRTQLRRQGLAINEDYLFYGDISEDTGYQALCYFNTLPAPPDYVIFLTDLQMLGASFYAQIHKLTIAFFAGIFSSDVSSFLPVKPIGFEVPFVQLGHGLADAILNAMQAETAGYIHQLPPLKLITARPHKPIKD